MKVLGKNIPSKYDFVVGVDEAGRGPLAGPVALGAVVIHKDFDEAFFEGIRDSKKLSEEKREEWFALAKELKKDGKIDFAVCLVSENIIDKRGISYAIRLGIKRCLEKLKVSEKAQIFLDGGIKAPENFVFQQTIIKGDESVPVISLASICAKVTRDRYMVKLSKKHPKYGFDVHKGYGTRMHRDAIKRHGPEEPHRTSFLRHLTK